MTNLFPRIIRGVSTTAVRTLYQIKGRPPKEAVPTQKILVLRTHQAFQIEPRIPVEAEELHKENWVIQNATDPDHFNHFLAHIFHPKRSNPNLPILLLVPGMLCNGNLFRLSPLETNFRNLKSPFSFANALAYEGFHVVLANPRYCRWIYTRFVHRKLGIKNFFSEAVDFKRLVGDLAFYIEAALSLSGGRSIAVLGFSMGGMELTHYLATQQIDPRLTHAVFMGAPVKFSHQQTLVMLFTIYNWLAQFIPLRSYRTLEFGARNLLPIKKILAKFPPKIIAGIPLAEELFNPEYVNLEEVIPFITYVLEPMPSPVITFLLETATRGGLPEISMLSRSQVPSLIVSGNRDGLVSTDSNRKLIEAIGSSKKELKIIEDAGHLDLVAGLKFKETVQAVVDFLTRE